MGLYIMELIGPTGTNEQEVTVWDKNLPLQALKALLVV